MLPSGAILARTTVFFSPNRNGTVSNNRPSRFQAAGNLRQSAKIIRHVFEHVEAEHAVERRISKREAGDVFVADALAIAGAEGNLAAQKLAADGARKSAANLAEQNTLLFGTVNRSIAIQAHQLRKHVVTGTLAAIQAALTNLPFAPRRQHTTVGVRTGKHEIRGQRCFATTNDAISRQCKRARFCRQQRALTGDQRFKVARPHLVKGWLIARAPNLERVFARINFWRGLRGNGTYRVRLRRAGRFDLKACFQFHDLQEELQAISLHAFEQRIVRKRLQLRGEFPGPKARFGCK